MPYRQTMKTTSTAAVVQVVWSSRRGAGREIEHMGSAYDEAELDPTCALMWSNSGSLMLLPGLLRPPP